MNKQLKVWLAIALGVLATVFLTRWALKGLKNHIGFNFRKEIGVDWRTIPDRVT